MQNITTTVPHSADLNNKTVTGATALSNVFNNQFTSIAKKANCDVKFSPKHYKNYLSYADTNTFFLNPTEKYEISVIIYSLDSHKVSGQYSFRVKILKLLKNDISHPLRESFNMSFSTGQFSSVIKIAKVIPIHKN